MVVELGDHDLVAGPQSRPSPRARWKVSVVMLAPNAISPGSHPGSRPAPTSFRDQGVGFFAGRIGPVGVRVVVVEVVGHGLYHRPGNLGSAGPSK